MENNGVVIIGGGLAGLCCASYLTKAGWNCQVLEAAPEPGGRMYTDYYDGFLLDRGFQIFLTAYPEAKKILNYESLQLHSFRSGAIIRLNDRFVKFVNPLREPSAMPQAMLSPVGTLADKFNVSRLVLELNSLSEEAIWEDPASSTISYLSQFGWSEKMIKSFFQPFFGGVFLEKELYTSSNLFRFVFQQFFLGDAALPAQGIQAIPQQIASTLPAGCLQTNIRVTGIEGNTLMLENGLTLEASTIVLATDALTSAKLLNENTPPEFNQSTCLYFAAPRSPLDAPMLVINSDSQALINHLCVPSDIAPGYAPSGQSLISVNIVGPVSGNFQQVEEGVKAELLQWFGEQVYQWRHLKTYSIKEALPVFTADQPEVKQVKIGEKLFRCGDYMSYPSQNGAMKSGRLVAQLITGQLTQ